MICNKCNNEGVLVTILGKDSYYCRTCKDDIKLEDKTLTEPWSCPYCVDTIPHVLHPRTSYSNQSITNYIAETQKRINEITFDITKRQDEMNQPKIEMCYPNEYLYSFWYDIPLPKEWCDELNALNFSFNSQNELKVKGMLMSDAVAKLKIVDFKELFIKLCKKVGS